MSGKAPPRGPRALFNQPPPVALSSSPLSPSFPVASSSKLSSSSPLVLVNPLKAVTGTGAAPPTGPRSLMNGNQSSQKIQPKPYVNGFSHSPTTSSVTNAISSPRYNQNAIGSTSSKGKAVDNAYINGSSGTNDQPSSISLSNGFSAANGRKAPPTGPSALVNPTTSFTTLVSTSLASTSYDRPSSPSAIKRPTTISKQPVHPVNTLPPPPADTPPPPPPPPPLPLDTTNSKNSVSDKLPHLESPLVLRFTQAHEPKAPPPPLPPPSQASAPPPPPPPPPAFSQPLRRDATVPTITLPPRPVAPIPQLPPRPLSSIHSSSLLTRASLTPHSSSPQPLSQSPSGTVSSASTNARSLSSLQLPQLPPSPLPEAVEPIIPDYVEVTTKVVNGIAAKFYSLKPLPSWPPPPSTFPPGSDFKILYDPAVDKDRYGKFSEIIEIVRSAISKSSDDKDASESGQREESGEHSNKVSISERLKGKGKGREVLYRYNGETLPGETPVVPKDPRKAQGFKRTNRIREDYYMPIYEHDADSLGPPPATTVLILHLPVLVPNAQIRRHFSTYGKIMSFEAEIDRATGAALGIVSITFPTHEEAKKCVANEDGKKFGEAAKGLGLGIGAGMNGEQEMRVVLDGEGKKVKEVLKEIEERKRKELEEKKRREKEKEAMLAANISGSGSVRQSNLNAVHVNGQASTPNSWRNQQQAGPSSHAQPSHMNGRPHQSYPPRGPSAPSSLFRARGSNSVANNGLPSRPLLPDSLEIDPSSLQSTHSQESTPLPPSFMRDRYRQTTMSRNISTNQFFSHNTPNSASLRGFSRSPSPGSLSRQPGLSLRAKYEKDTDHREVMEELARNGFDYVRIDAAQVGSGVREDDVRSYFDGLKVDKVLQDRNGWYVTFKTSDSARRAEMVLGIGNRLLANRSVTIFVHGAPSKSEVKAEAQSSSQATKQTRVWSNEELVNSAEKIIAKELKALLEKDVTDRVAGVHIRKVLAEEKNRKADEKEKFIVDSGQSDSRQPVVAEKKGLQGLSFRKRRQDLKVTAEIYVEPEEALLSATVVEESRPSANSERPKKRPKLDNKKVLPREDIESEDEDGSTTLVSAAVSSSTETGQKRSLTPDLLSDDIEKPPKKAKIIDEPATPDIPRVETKKEVVKKPSKKAAKRSKKAKTVEQEVVTVVPPVIEPPAVAEVHLTPTPIWDSSLSPSLSPVPPETKAQPIPAPVEPVPELDPIKEGICADDEDLYFAKLAVELILDPKFVIPGPIPSDPNAPPPFRKHVTGSARTEGYYKISHAEKAAYVAQYANRNTTKDAAPEPSIQEAPQVTSSRSNRLNARRRAPLIEEINQLEYAKAISMGKTGATDTIKYNQLQTRKKNLRFARSPIHDWGLYAMERISRGEMVIEYVGEVIRAAVADKRERAYERQGIGSSYLFRIDEDLVVDATKKGNLGRLINHCCDPNCTAKIITINGEKKIVIYAKQDIELGDEITYDYHFPIEQDKIPCLCGSAKCRGYLN